MTETSAGQPSGSLGSLSEEQFEFRAHLVQSSMEIACLFDMCELDSETIVEHVVIERQKDAALCRENIEVIARPHGNSIDKCRCQRGCFHRRVFPDAWIPVASEKDPFVSQRRLDSVC